MELEIPTPRHHKLLGSSAQIRGEELLFLVDCISALKSLPVCMSLDAVQLEMMGH